jgi:hypothetical protein
MEVRELEKLVMILIHERNAGRHGSPAYYNAWNQLADEDYSDVEIETLIHEWKYMLNGQVS